MNKYFFQEEYSPGFINKHFKRYKYREGKEEGEFVISSKGRYVEMFKIFHDGLTLYGRYPFQGEILRLEILESKYHASDFIWILDNLGRFCCWRPDQGYQFADNTIREEFLNNNQQYSEHFHQTSTETFSGINYSQEQDSINATIFYTMKSKIYLINILMKKEGIFLDSSHVMEYVVPFGVIRDMKWVRHYKQFFLIGMIVEQGEKTRFQVYDLELGEGFGEVALEYQLQKVNLLGFYSEIAGEILILTYHQIALYSYKINEPIRNYRTRGNYGQGFYLGDNLYGQIGEEVTLFSRNELKAYGKIVWDDDKLLKESGLINATILRHNDTKGHLLAITTYDEVIYIILLQMNQAKVIQKFNNIGRIEHISLLAAPKKGLVLGNQSKNKGSIKINTFYKQKLLQIQKQQEFPYKIQKIYPISQGIYLLIHCLQSNPIFRLNKTTSTYTFYFTLPPGNIIQAGQKFIIYEDGILQVDYQSNQYWVVKEEVVVLGKVCQDGIYYLNGDGEVRFYDQEGEKDFVLEAGREEDYCWGIISRNSLLICANLSALNQLKLINSTQKTNITIRGHTLVHNISSVAIAKGRESVRLLENAKEILLIAYVDGSIHFHTQSSQLLHIFHNISINPITLTQISQSQILISSNQTNSFYLYEYSKNKFQYSSLYIGGNTRLINGMVYIKKCNKVMMVEMEDERRRGGNCVKILGLEGLDRKEEDVWGEVGVIYEGGSQSFFVIDVEDEIIVVEPYRVRSINPYSKFHKLYPHPLSTVQHCISIQLGILFCGHTPNNHQQIIIITSSLEPLKILPYEHQIHTLTPTSNPNEFFMRTTHNLTLQSINNNHQIKQLMGVKVTDQGYKLDVDDGRRHLMMNDAWRGLFLYEYDVNINLLGKFVPAFEIVSCKFYGQGIVVGDSRGVVYMLAYEIDRIPQFKVKFTKIFSIQLSSTITAFYRHPGEDYLLYALEDTKVYKLRGIGKQQFYGLRLQENKDEQGVVGGVMKRFNYNQWRQPSQKSRLIDAQIFQNTSQLEQLINLTKQP